MPRAWVVLRRSWVALFTGSLGLAILLPQLQGLSGQNQDAWSLQSWILCSIAFMLFLLPHNSQDVIVCSTRELFFWQLKSFMGSLIIGIGSLICAAQIVHALSHWTVALLCGVLLICLLTSPWFFRLCAWRIWGGIALIVACA